MCVCVGVAATSVQPKFGETTTSYLDESTSPADFGEIWTLSSVRRGLDLGAHSLSVVEDSNCWVRSEIEVPAPARC